MAMFLESSDSSYKEVENTDSVLTILEDLMDLTLELASFNENIIQEEYTILSEETEDKKVGLLEKVKRFIIQFYRKIVALVIRIRQKLSSFFKSKKDNETIKIYKSYEEYLSTIFNGLEKAVNINAKLDDITNWMDDIKFAFKGLNDKEIIEVKTSTFNEMISKMENISSSVTRMIKKLEEGIDTTKDEKDLKLYHSDISKYREVLNILTRALSIIPKAFPKADKE